MGVIRELPAPEIERLLHDSLIARIACCDHESDRPYLVPIAYGYDGESLLLHSGPGRKIDLMRRQPLVSVEVDEGESGDRWRSVVVEATYEEVQEPVERLEILTTMYGDGSSIPELPESTIVVRLRITSKSGRYELPE